MRRLGFCTLALAAFVWASAVPVATADDGSVIDVFIAYTPEVANGVGAAGAVAAINRAVSDVNTALSNSGVLFQLRIVGTAQVDFNGTPGNDEVVLQQLRAQDGVADALLAFRESTKADLVHMVLEPTDLNAGCGGGFIMGPGDVGPQFADRAFSITQWSCLNYVGAAYQLGHAVGHNMGLQHAVVDGEHHGHAPAFEYGHGYRDPQNRFRDVMAEDKIPCSTCPNATGDYNIPRVQMFSNTTRTVNGAPVGDAATADAARALNNVRAIVANFRTAGGTPGPTATPTPSPGGERPVVWKNVVGVAASGNSLSKTAAEGWNAGAVSVRSLASGDGYVRFTATELDKGRMVGLGNGDAGQSYVDVEYGLLLRGDALLAIYEAGVFRGMFGGYATGDVLQVGVESGVVRYRKNGALLFSSPAAPSYPLVVDTALYHQGSTVSNAVLGGGLASNTAPVAKAGGPYRWTAGRNIRFDGTGSSDDGSIVSYAWDFGDGMTGTGASPTHAYSSAGSYTARLTVTDNDGGTAAVSASVVVDDPALEKAVSWTNAVGVAASGNNLSKTAPEGWNAGAVSTKSLSSGEGYAAVTASETSLGRLFGLGNGDAGQSFTDVEYGILLRGDALVAIYESGMFRGVFGSYASGDVFRVGVEAGVVRYRKNGALLFTSAIAPTYPLLLDTALYHSGSTLSAAAFGGAPNSAPVANAGGSYRWPSGRAIRFDGRGSSDDGSIVSYAWSFGDGTTGTGATPSHAYASAGSYTATLTVTDDLGVSATASASVTVESPATEQPVFWTNAVGMSVMGSSLSKVAADGWGNGGAVSTKSLSSGDGYILFVAEETNKGRMAGLGRGDTDQGYADVEYGLLLRGDGLVAIYDSGVYRGLFGSYAGGDVLRVGVESGLVRYRRNGALLFTSPTAPAYPLLMDTAFYHAASTVSNAVIAGSLTP